MMMMMEGVKYMNLGIKRGIGQTAKGSKDYDDLQVKQ
jgi:hypothetical protein